MSRKRVKGDEATGPSTNGEPVASKAAKTSPSPLSLPMVLSVLPQWSLILSLIFVGCCSNAYYLELSTSVQPRCGTLLTFSNFLLTALVNLGSQIVWKPFPGSGGALRYPAIKKSKVPISRWMVQVVLYFVCNLLNNTAFAFRVPMPVHIIFRSGGLVVNMVVGRVVRKKRYSPLQIASVLLVTFGVLLATLATSPTSSSPSDSGSASAASPSGSILGLSHDALRYLMGVSLLFLALLLSSLMGLYQELTFAKYGSEHWREALFYSHALSLPLFGLRWSNLRQEWDEALVTRPMWVGWDWKSAALIASTGGGGALARGARAGNETLAALPSSAHAIKEAVNALGGASAVAQLERRRVAPGGVWDLRALTLELARFSGLGGGSRFQSALEGPLAWLGASLSSLLFSINGAGGLSGQNKIGALGPGLVLPSLFPPLILNVLTQLLCINGVNRLTSQVSSLTVTLVLVVRKAVSLAISVLLVKGGGGGGDGQSTSASRANWQLAIGAALVLGGTVGYAMGSAGAPTTKDAKKDKKE